MKFANFVQIHSIHSYSAALINRDDAGLAKRMPFGGAMRTRISSQCLKRHWRVVDDEFAIHRIAGVNGAIRSRNLINREVIQPLIDSGRFADSVLDAVGAEFNIGVYGKSGTSESGRQPLLLGKPEIDHLRQRAESICAENPSDAKSAAAAAKQLFNSRRGEGKNFKALLDGVRLPAGLEAALFGRMVTSDPAANLDAAIHVAHSITVHEEESESDYFSVVDDLQAESEDAGAAHIGETELTAGIFYGYVVADLATLVSNLEGCHPSQWREADCNLAGTVLDHLVHLIATVSPGAKRGSTAPYGYADLMLVEIGARQPRSLANAFREAVPAHTSEALKALSKHLGELDSAYGLNESRRYMATQDWQAPEADRLSLDDLGAWLAQEIRRVPKL